MTTTDEEMNIGPVQAEVDFLNSWCRFEEYYNRREVENTGADMEKQL